MYDDQQALPQDKDEDRACWARSRRLDRVAITGPSCAELTRVVVAMGYPTTLQRAGSGLPSKTGGKHMEKVVGHRPVHIVDDHAVTYCTATQLSNQTLLPLESYTSNKIYDTF
jgi:hypothetical protein